MDCPSPSHPNWLEILRRAEPDRVVWIHERDLQEELLQEYREALHATCGSLAGECSLAGGEPLKTWEQIDRLLMHFRNWGVTGPLLWSRPGAAHSAMRWVLPPPFGSEECG